MSERVSEDMSEKMSEDMSEKCQKYVRKNVRSFVGKNVKRYLRKNVRRFTYLLTFFLTYLLTNLLTFFLRYLLTFFPTKLLTFFLTYFWHFSDISSDILSHITFNIHSDSVMLNGMMMGPWIHRWICNIPSSQPQQSESVPKVPTCVGHFHLNKGEEMSVHFRNCWMDFDICCFELASLDVLISADSRFKPVVGGEIWYPCSAKWQRERWSQKAPFFGVRKNAILSASEKTSFFRTPNRTSWQCKNITRKRKHDGKIWKICAENIPKKVTFFGILFCTGSGASEKTQLFRTK